jgi:hypothetical protein
MLSDNAEISGLLERLLGWKKDCTLAIFSFNVRTLVFYIARYAGVYPSCPKSCVSPDFGHNRSIGLSNGPQGLIVHEVFTQHESRKATIIFRADLGITRFIGCTKPSPFAQGVMGSHSYGLPFIRKPTPTRVFFFDNSRRGARWHCSFSTKDYKLRCFVHCCHVRLFSAQSARPGRCLRQMDTRTLPRNLLSHNLIQERSRTRCSIETQPRPLAR